MANKNHLTLYIDNDLVNMAKNSNMNLSAEFEEWIRIRLNQSEEIKPIENIPMEIAKLQSEIHRLENLKTISIEKQTIEKEQDNSLDIIIDNMKVMNEELLNPNDAKIHGVQFIFKKRYNKILNPLQAKELLLKRIKDRNL